MKELQDKYKTILQNFKLKWVHCTKKWALTHWLAACLYWYKCHFLIAIFYALQGYPYDQNYVQFFGFPSLGEPDPMYILPVLSALSTWIMSKQTSSSCNWCCCATTKDYDNLYAFIHWLHLP